MAVFYGQVKDEGFRKQMKENRKIEELILMFATNATNVLRKEPSLAGDGWKAYGFVSLVSSALFTGMYAVVAAADSAGCCCTTVAVSLLRFVRQQR